MGTRRYKALVLGDEEPIARAKASVDSNVLLKHLVDWEFSSSVDSIRLGDFDAAIILWQGEHDREDLHKAIEDCAGQGLTVHVVLPLADDETSFKLRKLCEDREVQPFDATGELNDATLEGALRVDISKLKLMVDSLAQDFRDLTQDALKAFSNPNGHYAALFRSFVDHALDFLADESQDRALCGSCLQLVLNAIAATHLEGPHAYEWKHEWDRSVEINSGVYKSIAFELLKELPKLDLRPAEIGTRLVLDTDDTMVHLSVRHEVEDPLRRDILKATLREYGGSIDFSHKRANDERNWVRISLRSKPQD